MYRLKVPRFIAAIGAALLIAHATVAFAAVNPDYKIHPGDQLNVSVYGEPTLTQTVTVLSDSTIEYPMIGRVSLADQTPAQASETLHRAFAKYIRQPIVSVAVLTVGQLTVMVLGNVKQPGKYVLPYGSRVTDAIAAAGGVGPTNGAYPVVRLSETTGVRDANLEDILRHGDTADDLALTDKSAVYVPSPVTFSVEVVGAVDKPGEVTVSQGDRLSVAIAKAGNSVGANADLNSIRVTRDIGNGQTQVFTVDLYQELQHGNVASDIVLQKNDVVYVPQAKKGGSAVTGSILGLIGRVFGL